MSRPTPGLRCVTLVAESTVREAMRQRLFLLVAGTAAAFAGGALALREFNLGASEPRFLMDVGFGAQGVFGAVLAIVASAQLFFAEFERRTALIVLARPVRRREFVFGKLGGVLVLLLGFCALMTGLLVAVLWWRGAGLDRMGEGSTVLRTGPRLGDVAWCGLVGWLRLGVLAAMTMLVASYARSSLFSVVSGFLLLIIAQMQHVAREFLGWVEAPWARGAAWLVRLLIPDFRLLDLTDQVVAGEALSGGLLCATVLYALTYLGLFSVLSAFCLRHREL